MNQCKSLALIRVGTQCKTVIFLYFELFFHSDCKRYGLGGDAEIDHS